MGRTTRRWLAALCWIGAGLQARTIHVPADVASIQAAIEAARDGDEIVVAAGTYEGPIDFVGKAVRLRSAEGPETTAIAVRPEWETSVVFFRNGETRDAVLEGFTITGGTGTEVEGEVLGGPIAGLAGGGILVMNHSLPTIRGNVIRDNTVASLIMEPTAGGGIAILEESSPLVEGNEIAKNGAQAGGGIAIGVRSNPDVRGNTITGNEADYGGGIFVADASAPLIEENAVRGNAAGWGGGLYVQTWTAGGVGAPQDPVPLTWIAANEIVANQASTAGGGVCLFRAKAAIERCVIAGNAAVSEPLGAGWGGGIYAESTNATVASCFILRNRAYSGAGIYIQGPESSVGILHATILENEGVFGGGICMHPEPVPGTEIRNSILWDNRGPGVLQPVESENLYNGEPGMVHHCDFSDGLYEGRNGNFSADPRFRDPSAGDLHLREGSPCIDVGEAVPLPDVEVDIDGEPRPLDGDGDGVPVPDVGADEYVPSPLRLIRGHCNATPGIDLSDPIFLLSYLFSGGPGPDCADACDANDDGRLDLADAVNLLNYLFGGGPPPADPFPDCGPDPTADDLGCGAFPPCM